MSINLMKACNFVYTAILQSQAEGRSERDLSEILQLQRGFWRRKQPMTGQRHGDDVCNHCKSFHRKQCSCHSKPGSTRQQAQSKPQQSDQSGNIVSYYWDHEETIRKTEFSFQAQFIQSKSARYVQVTVRIFNPLWRLGTLSKNKMMTLSFLQYATSLLGTWKIVKTDHTYAVVIIAEKIPTTGINHQRQYQQILDVVSNTIEQKLREEGANMASLLRLTTEQRAEQINIHSECFEAIYKFNDTLLSYGRTFPRQKSPVPTAIAEENITLNVESHKQQILRTPQLLTTDQLAQMLTDRQREHCLYVRSDGRMGSQNYCCILMGSKYLSAFIVQLLHNHQTLELQRTLDSERLPKIRLQVRSHHQPLSASIRKEMLVRSVRWIFNMLVGTQPAQINQTPDPPEKLHARFPARIASALQTIFARLMQSPRDDAVEYLHYVLTKLSWQLPKIKL